MMALQIFKIHYLLTIPIPIKLLIEIYPHLTILKRRDTNVFEVLHFNIINHLNTLFYGSF